ncbi:MAG TPA: hypothetical protein VFW46_11185 [Stellaceae bacterium]|nr:hypothetical protein [Stellaceae bacterium]
MNEPDLTIDPARLTYPAGHAPATRYAGTYEYTAECFDKIAGSFLFWGPYLDLDPGVCVVEFLGEVAGQFCVEFIHDSGRMRIKQITVDDFAAPVCLVLRRAVARFEIRGIKTRSLERLKLDAIRLHYAYRPVEAA